MEPFIPFEGVIQAELIYSVQDQIVENVLHYHSTLTITESELGRLKDGLSSWWNTAGKLNLSSAVALERIKCTDLTTDSGPAIDVPITPPVFGTHAGETLPLNVAGLVKFTTGLRGRSYRGRMFIVPLCEDQVVENQIDPAILAAMSARYDALKSITVLGTTFTLVIASRQHAGVRRTVGVWVPVTTVALLPQVATQRRRMPGRGR